MNNYKIYKVINYNNTYHNDLNAFCSNDIKEINKELNYDKAYHLLLKNDLQYKLFFDIDNVNDDKIFIDFIKFIENQYQLNFNDAAATKSINSKGLNSYHLVYNNCKGYLHNFKKMCDDIKNNEEYKNKFNNILDSSIYKHNQWFRLPNQTNQNKHNSHTIIRGNIEDFVFEYLINNNDENYVCDKLNKYNINKIKYYHDYNTKFNYDIHDDIIKKCLDNLSDEYLEDYDLWIKVTNCMKNLNKKKLWDDWSKNGYSYNYHKNQKLWKNQKKSVFSLEWLLKNTNTNFTNIKKNYKPLIKQINNTKIMNNNRMFDKNYYGTQFTYNDLCSNDIIIKQSTTGTGKTTATAIHIAKYLQENKQFRVLSIIDRVILANQHIKSFADQGIQIKSYKNENFMFDNYIVCINSLLKINKLYESNEIKNYIVYIDEIDGFLQFTHNDQLNKNMKAIYLLFIYILKNCHKIIVSDAIISDNVVNLLNTVKYSNKIFIKNIFKKYDGIKAIKINDENIFIQKIKQHIESNKYFLFLSDSATIINKLYHESFDKNKEDKFFIYIDANKTDIINDASEQLKNKFVFASPSIERGLDFSIEEKQDVFIYITGRSINSQGLFQQTTRTRNIDQLYYYGIVNNYPAKYDNIDDVVDIYLNNIKQNNILNNICINIDDDDQIKMNNNTFFQLFCYNEYKNDTLNTNIIAHYEQQLINNGFVLSNIGDKIKINNEKKIEINERIKKINEKIFNEYITLIKNKNHVKKLTKKYEKMIVLNNQSEEIIDNTMVNTKEYDILFKQLDENINEQKKIYLYDKIDERVKILNLPKNNIDILIKYKDQLTDPFKLTDHYNTIRMFKPIYYIESKFYDAIINNFECKYINNIYNKIKIIKNIEQKYNIKNFNTNSYEKNILTDNEYNLIKNLFRINKIKPNNNYEIIIMYVTMIKNICGSDIIKYKQTMINGKRKYEYYYNDEYIKFHKKLTSYYITNNEFEFNNTVILKNIKININLDEISEIIKNGKIFIKKYYDLKN